MRYILALTFGLVAAATLTRDTCAKMNVVTTSTMVTDMVKEVGGDRINVVVLVVGPPRRRTHHELHHPQSSACTTRQRTGANAAGGARAVGRNAEEEGHIAA